MFSQQTYETIKQRILDNINISDDQISREGIIRDISLISKEEHNNKNTNDFYANPGSMIKNTLKENESDNIKINLYSILSTPEKYLKQLSTDLKVSYDGP